MKIFIKSMMSLRCKMLVREELRNIGLKYSSVELGMVDLKNDITDKQRELLNERLKKSGLELVDDKKKGLVERIEGVINEMIHNFIEVPRVNDSDYISDRLGYDYPYLASTFSAVKGITIQKYIIKQKIEAVKELMLYDELTLTEIAYKLNYSSVAHLSNQFKKVTGHRPSYYKEKIKKSSKKKSSKQVVS